MPIFQVSLVETPSREERRQLLSNLLYPLATSVAMHNEDVALMLQTMPADAWAASGAAVSALRPAS
jgi:phenylpyruvate tautomerase PptA (4-oxalocrotonate tautomerase family)